MRSQEGETQNEVAKDRASRGDLQMDGAEEGEEEYLANLNIVKSNADKTV